MLTAMAGVHDADVHKGTDEAVVVQLAMALASRTYGEDKLSERKIKESLVRASHG